MDSSCRLFLCADCRTQVVVCRPCDRGQIYCDDRCGPQARRRKCREAGQRYQASPRGRVKHAARQHRYRARKRDSANKVTHQGSPPPPPDDVLPVNSTAPAKPRESSETTSPEATPPCLVTLTCRFCRRLQSGLLRRNPLRRRVRRSPDSHHANGGFL